MKTTLMIAIAVLFLSGCSDGLRFPPSESQKESAFLGFKANTEIYNNGTEAKSNISEVALQSSQASLGYTGMPATVPTMEMASVVNSEAQIQALQRPTVDETIDYYTALIGGIGGILLVGTPAGIKLADYLKKLQELRDAKLVVDKKYQAIKSGVNKTLAEEPKEMSETLYKNIGEERAKAGIS